MEQSAFEKFELGISEEIKGYLKETATWAYFLSILGFIGLGLMVLMGLFFGTILSSMPGGDPYSELGFSGGFVGIFYVIIALIYFFPILYLFRFAKKMKDALRGNDNVELTAAFSNLKSHYKFVGIFTIVILSLYVLIFIIAMLVGASSAF